MGRWCRHSICFRIQVIQAPEEEVGLGRVESGLQLWSPSAPAPQALLAQAQAARGLHFLLHVAWVQIPPPVF